MQNDDDDDGGELNCSSRQGQQEAEEEEIRPKVSAALEQARHLKSKRKAAAQEDVQSSQAP